MSWMKDRDSLIAQTMAFVQSVTGRREELRPDLKQVLPPVEVDVRAELATALEIVDAAEPPPVTVSQPRQVVLTDIQKEIRDRVASFRAHQQRFNKEREEYFSATIARLKASMKDLPPPRAGK
ncbi:MAG TPA: hypothetical protein VGH70_13150 [Bradyrhizobium sp.]